MNPKNKKLLPLFLAVGGLGLMTVVQVAGATHPRPLAASPVSVSLVPAYEQCTSPNSTHGPPLTFPSCTPPVQTSKFLTVGTFDANGAAANSVGLVRVGVHVGAPGPPEDSAVQIRASITDVRCKSGGSACGPANAEDGPDYTGQLEGNANIRITDHYNGPNRDQPATVRDLPLPFVLSCASTADTSIGSTCAIPTVTCLSCPPPKEGVRTVVEMTQVRVSDGGPDGVVSTDDNSLFMVQGVFIP
jgi:hypothetical protein